MLGHGNDSENSHFFGFSGFPLFSIAPGCFLFSIVIPARDEEGCIASTVEHLHLELDLRGVPSHEIIVVKSNEL
jgi:hypothetical protein